MKRADELRVGDVLIRTARNAVVVDARRVAGGISVIAATAGIGCGVEPPYVYAPDYQFDVQARELTPAQVHADDLLDLVRTITPIPGPWADQQRAVLAKIDPPVPPTLHELAAALASLLVGTSGSSAAVAAEALVERARRAGLLP